jgi:hypothetical protein
MRASRKEAAKWSEKQTHYMVKRRTSKERPVNTTAPVPHKKRHLPSHAVLRIQAAARGFLARQRVRAMRSGVAPAKADQWAQKQKDHLIKRRPSKEAARPFRARDLEVALPGQMTPGRNTVSWGHAGAQVFDSVSFDVPVAPSTLRRRSVDVPPAA